MSTYDVDNVTVSLSRLALAKAIKTPDEEDGADAEPWVKSVIFHQSHVSDAMRDSIEHPGRKSRHMMQQQQQRARPRSQVLLQSEQQQRPPMGDQRKRTRSSSQFLDRTPQQFDRAPRNDTEMRIEQYRQSSVMNNSSSTLRTVGSTSTSDNLSSPGASQRPIKKILQQQQLDSDDDESENDMDNGSEDDDDSDASGPTPAVRKSSTNLMLSGQRVTPRSSSNDIAVTATATPAARKSNFMLSGNRASQHIPAPSDEDEDEDAADSDDDKSDSSAPTHSARKSSTNLMLSGSRASQHLPPPSDDDEDDDDHSQDDDDSSEEQVIVQAKPAISKRASAMILGSTTASSEDENLKARRMSTLRQLERGPSMHRRSRSSGDINLIAHMQQQQQAPKPYMEGEISPVSSGKTSAIERWRQVVSVMAEEPQPESLADSLPETASPTMHEKRSNAVPPGYRRNRRSTMSEMDAMYNPQAAMVPTMQWQMQHAQQMAQIQQYQNAAMMMAPTPPPQPSASTGWSSSMGNRRSISAMDMLENLEREKQESRKHKKNEKRIDASKARIEGLLGQLPSKSTHTLSFQQMEQEGGVGRGAHNGGGIGYGYQQHLIRASQSDMDLSRLSQQRRSRSPGPERALRPDNHGKKKMSSTDARRRSEMIRSESAPRLSSSKSTPLNEQHRQSMMSMQTPMYGQFLSPYGIGMPMAASPQPGYMMMAPPSQMMTPPPQPMMMAPSASTGRPVRNGNNNNRRPSTGNWAQGYQ